jgi:hypothetical protein
MVIRTEKSQSLEYVPADGAILLLKSRDLRHAPPAVVQYYHSSCAFANTSAGFSSVTLSYRGWIR